MAHFGKIRTGTHSKVIYGVILIQINDDRQFTAQLTSID